LTHRVGPGESGQRVDQFLARAGLAPSRAEAQRWLDAGAVTVNGAQVAKRHLLRTGEIVRAEPPATQTLLDHLIPDDTPVTIHYEDEHLLVAEKPPGMATHPSAGHARGTLVHALLGRSIAGGDDPVRPGIVHRLDLDTSGLIIVARTPSAHRTLQAQLREREIERRYLALVHGAIPPALTIDRPIGRDRRVRTRMSTTTMDGRSAVTHVRRLEVIGGFALVDVRLETGRTHQIRVHLEDVGFPVAGDPVYGGRRGDPLRVGRQFLHAWRLAFPHPEDGTEIVIESPLPTDLEAALGRARALSTPNR
jgi:23S rRNA pseudouridine1911/1915/1917 synthase